MIREGFLKVFVCRNRLSQCLLADVYPLSIGLFQFLFQSVAHLVLPEGWGEGFHLSKHKSITWALSLKNLQIWVSNVAVPNGSFSQGDTQHIRIRERQSKMF